jgi:ApeA N-terminal domain 1
VIGAHVSPDQLYTQLRCRIPGLHIWLSQKVVDQCLHTMGDQITDVAAEYRILKLPEVITPIPNVKANIGWGIGVTLQADHFKVSVNSVGWLRINPDSPQPLDWFFEQLGKLTTLLTFLFGSSASPDCLSLSLGNLKQEAALLTGSRDFKTCTYSNLHEFYMTRLDMGKTLEDVIQRWFKEYDNIMVPSQLAVSVLVSEDLWLYVEFLSLMQALEGFYRSQLAGLYMLPEDYKSVACALVKAIPSNVSANHRDSLRSRIGFANEISQKNRLKDLAGRLSSPIRQLIFGRDGKVPLEWVDTRNYYTHWSEQSRQKVLDGQGMLDANVRIRHFLRALYLDIAGIPQAAILEALGNASSESQRLSQVNARDRWRTDPSDTSVSS